MRFLIAVIAGCALLTGSPHPQSKQDAAVATRIRAYLAPFAATGNLAGTVLVARNGQVLFEQSYGMANYEWQIPNSAKTRFHIASVSKLFTAAAILQLQEQGRLQVSDPISQYLPDFPQGNRITLDNLLTQTSGIPDINDLDDYDTFARSPHTLDQQIAKFAGLPLKFQPGSKASYSNSNYILLATIIEKVSGQNYADYLAAHIFVPCGLQDTGNDGDATRIIPFSAAGYEPVELTGYKKAPYVDWSNKTGSGSLYSTAEDLLRFDRALNSGKVLSEATRKKYYVYGDDNTYGWYFYNPNEQHGFESGHRLMAGKGHGTGFSAELDDYPDDGLTIIILSNSFSTVTQDPIIGGLAAIVFGNDPPKPPALSLAPLPESDLSAYAGEYQYGPEYFDPNVKFTLRPHAGSLVLDFGDRQSPLVSAGHDEFIERRFFGSIKIIRDTQGKVTGLVTRYGTKNFAAKRLRP
jgi:CubicO group peptidase (beta-lactamase class C family)